MFAILALVCFILATVDTTVGPLTPINLISLGLAFVAAHLLYAWVPWGRRPPA